MHSKYLAAALSGIAVAVAATDCLAGGGNQIGETMMTGVTDASNLGIPVTIAGAMGTVGSALARNGGLVAGGLTVTGCGAAWTSSPDWVPTLIGRASGLGFSDLATLVDISLTQKLLALVIG